MRILDEGEWRAAAAAHEARADELTAGHRARKAARQKHAIEDFLFTYYSTKPGQLRRWYPGAGVGLAPGPDGPAPQGGWRWYSTDADGVVSVDLGQFLAERGETVRFVHRLLEATASRPAFTGCFGLHEWAMVYRQAEHRHPLPLRLGQAGTDAVVESHPIRCSHFDAFRFFTPEAVGLNKLQPARETQVQLEQPGCLHAGMDLYKWAAKLGPLVPGDLLLDCFDLALEARRLDMAASPYDVSSYGEGAVAIETAEGKGEYVERQRELALRTAGLRSRLTGLCSLALESTGSV
ncbi:3-methyladenine DNA glycosylase [Intrasporangium calvum]|uniref:3-methyladenine DNA glycosylase n=1 Tax=Intrasporangium calvum TaxID=53358 RepID=A0ABT5GGJ0_9MICO|nr:3-methyladenine DNA glycosylase [Intrasporangium calvum]MDC5697209.1 3-methyladenine DNA glycosylase [Intrasporangium calvum]